jgi:hypothetical protein
VAIRKAISSQRKRLSQACNLTAKYLLSGILAPIHTTMVRVQTWGRLLLEYGERDLYQSWADETNVPPVRAKEILRFWNSLFEVADAIRHVHHLEVPRGKGTLRYHG